MLRLARINLTALKGTALTHPASCMLAEHGLVGNRRFHLVDDRGRLFGASDHGSLVRIRADHDPAAGLLTLTFPDGRVVIGPAGDHGPAVVTDFYGRPVPGHLVEGPLAEALTDVIGRPVRLVRTDRPGDGSDVHRLSVMSTESVRDLGARSGRPDLDGRRFRIDLEVEGGVPFQEDAWRDRRLAVGDAIIGVLGPIPRCVVTTLDPATGVKDFDTLKRIAEFRPLMTEPRGVPFGMYAEVIRPATIHAGDPVEVVASA